MLAPRLEFLSTFLLRAPLLELRGECWESFAVEAGKRSRILSYEAETDLFLMLAVPSVFLLSGDGYVGELLELSQCW